MYQILRIIRNKPSMLLLFTVVYIFLTILLKWPSAVKPDTFWYLAGGLLGLYFLDVGELFFGISPSPFRTVVFQALFAITGLFIITSSTSIFAKGLVLSLSLQILFLQIGEWVVMKSIHSWYTMVASPVPLKMQKLGIIAFFALFVLETLIFIY